MIESSRRQAEPAIICQLDATWTVSKAITRKTMIPRPKKGQARTAAQACPKCGVQEIIENVRNCPACSTDWGPMNVRAAERKDERAALLDRSTKATESAERRKCTSQLDSLKSAVEISSHVVVAMPAFDARQLLRDRSSMYQNYENLVASGGRLPASLPDDHVRASVGALLFGSFAKAIRYGTLSLDGRGLPTYGTVFFKLRDVAVQDRVSFFEMNSYQFVEKFDLRPNKQIPQGYRSTWSDRHHLAAAKLCPKLTPGHTKAQWPGLLIKTDGKNRSKDEFIEAHIYGSFNASAVESASYAPKKTWAKDDKTDIPVIKELLAKIHLELGK